MIDGDHELRWVRSQARVNNLVGRSPGQRRRGCVPKPRAPLGTQTRKRTSSARSEFSLGFSLERRGGEVGFPKASRKLGWPLRTRRGCVPDSEFEQMAFVHPSHLRGTGLEVEVHDLKPSAFPVYLLKDCACGDGGHASAVWMGNASTSGPSAPARRRVRSTVAGVVSTACPSTSAGMKKVRPEPVPGSGPAHPDPGPEARSSRTEGGRSRQPRRTLVRRASSGSGSGDSC